MAFQPPFRRNFRVLIIVLFLFSVTLGIAGHLFHENQKRIVKEEKRDQLGAVADLKVRQISNWHQDRMADAAVIVECPFFAHLIQRFLRSPVEKEVKQEILNWMGSRQRHYQYQSLHLIDSKGTVRLSVPEGKEVLGPNAKALCAEAMRKKKIVFSDLYRGKIAKVVRLTLIVPILISEGNDTLPLGVLLLRIDPHQFLYPLVQSWLTQGDSSEILLLRREGGYIVFLNELRHQRDTALNLRFPIGNQQLPTAEAAYREEGAFEGIDYRGIPVLAAMRRIPDTSWFLVAKVDQEEIYAPIRRQAWYTGIVIGLWITGAGLSVGILWRHQRTQFYQRQYEAELEREALARHFDYLTKYANEIILLMDQDMKIVEVNDRAVESYGYSRDELLQLSLRQLQPSETGLDLFLPMKQAEEQDGLVFETEHQRRDGTRFPVETSSRMIQVEGKRFYQNIIRNITERKRAEEVLRESEHYFRSLIFNMHEDILVIDQAYRVTDVNNTLLVTAGLKREDAIGRHCYEVLHDYSQPCCRYGEECLLQAVFESGKPHHCRHIHSRSDSLSGRSKIWADILLSPLRDGHGNVTHVVEAVRDVTDLILTGEALRESEERYRLAIEYASDGVAIIKGDQPLFVNQKFVEIFGYGRPEEIIGKPLSMLVHPDDLRRVENFSPWRLKDEPIGLRYDFKGVRKSGESIHIEVSASPTSYRGEAVSLVYLRDVTERKRKEQEMSSLQEQLRQSQKMEALGRLAGGMAHDFNNFLTVIRGYSQLCLLEVREGNPFRENIEEILKATERAANLTCQILAFGRQQILEKRILDLNTVLRDLDKMLRQVIGEDTELGTLFADGLGEVKIDPVQIELVIMNLAINARDAMPSGGKLTIETANVELDETYCRNHVDVTPGHYVVLSISDTGVGMIPEVRERIFEPFFSTKEKGKGTGLGLSMVYGIVKQSGGHIEVDSEPGKGATFRIYLPRVDEPVVEVDEKEIGVASFRE